MYWVVYEAGRSVPLEVDMDKDLAEEIFEAAKEENKNHFNIEFIEGFGVSPYCESIRFTQMEIDTTQQKVNEMFFQDELETREQEKYGTYEDQVRQEYIDSRL